MLVRNKFKDWELYTPLQEFHDSKEFLSCDRNITTHKNFLPVTDIQEFSDPNKKSIPLTGTLFQNME